ncbi:unnamed protein product [Discosporangium mesarthrocarpum]
MEQISPSSEMMTEKALSTHAISQLGTVPPLGSAMSHTTYSDDQIPKPEKEGIAAIIRFLKLFWESTPHPWYQLCVIIIWAAGVALLNDERVLNAGIALDWNAGRTISIILSFLLVFRTNQSFGRWNEGRILWGRLTHCCTEITQHAACLIHDHALARRAMQQALAFAYATKQHLRHEKLRKEDLEEIISPAEVREVDRMNKLNIHVPLYSALCIRECIRTGITNPGTAQAVDSNVMVMTQVFEDMIRIHTTPQPTCYRTLLHFFIVLYLLLLPVISYELIGYFVIPEAAFTTYLMLGLQLAAEELEDPFGCDLNDLKLDKLWHVIRKQCLASFYLGLKGGHNLALPDGVGEVEKSNAPPGIASSTN